MRARCIAQLDKINSMILLLFFGTVACVEQDNMREVEGKKKWKEIYLMFVFVW